ncbi:MAG: EthD domain-containing protein [Acidimicrobiales bacterium]
MIKLTVLVKRNAALSVEDFHAEWRDHGRMIAAEPVFGRYIKRYEQHHRVAADYRNGQDYDGMAVQWFDSYREFIDLISTPEYRAKMQPDEERILDPDGLVVLFTEEAEVYIQ